MSNRTFLSSGRNRLENGVQQGPTFKTGNAMYLNMSGRAVSFSYYKDGLKFGPQRIFNAETGKVQEFFAENGSNCGKFSEFDMNGQVKTADLPACENVW